ncbi:hypothetical protein [Scandinavium sp.]|uniref:hypothetical protein n=1 Tax=Scandinavium sp. TaxID=2830653 RepID=UPI00289F9558|nr:hypothetical protein [Scandinavium sp.]
MIDQELQHALAFYQPPPQSWYDELADKAKASGQWLWETLQGDFNEQQTTGQIVTGTIISMIPLVDQVCDVRDLIANCKKIKENDTEIWPWVCLGLTLVGCFPTLGSLVKGSAKVMFLSIRKAHFNELSKAGNYNRLLDGSITQLNRFLDTPTVRGTLRTLRIYNPYHYLAGKIDELKKMLSTSALLEVMDKLMKVTRSLFDTVTRWGPSSLQRPVAALWETLVSVRSKANAMLAKALKPLNGILERLANRLRVEGDNAFRAHVGDNVHLYGATRASEELAFFKREKPDWVDLEAKEPKYEALDKFNFKDKVVAGWPDISETSKNPILKNKFDTFDNSMRAVEIPPGTVLYRVVDPSSGDNNICWMRKSEFDKLTSKSEWRRRFAVWKKWNENGEYVTYTVPPGQPLKVWEGRAGTQINREAPEYSLEGGAVQIVLDPSQLKKEYTGPRQKTGWGYGDAANDPVYPYQGLPKLENTHNWYEPKDKN